MAEITNISPDPVSGCECATGSSTNKSVETSGKEGQTTGAQFEDQTESLKAKAGEVGRRAKQTAKETTESAKATAQEVAERAKQQVSEMAEKVTEQGEGLLNQQKSKVASELHAYSEAARRAAGRLDEEGDVNLAHYLRSAADRVDSFGSHLRDSKLGHLVNEVEDVARRQPEVFFGAMFVTGLAVARFVKASRRKRMQDRVEFAASSRESGSTYYETQPVSGPSPARVYPSPAPVSTSSGSTPVNPGSMPL